MGCSLVWVFDAGFDNTADWNDEFGDAFESPLFDSI
jgi:hypothetical protein